MTAYLLFSLKNTISFAHSSRQNFKNRKSLIITDKIAIFNYLKKNNFTKVVCLDSYFLGNKKKKLFC